MLNKKVDVFEKQRSKIITRLNKEGIRVKRGKRKPVNGQYSGIISCEKKVLKLYL